VELQFWNKLVKESVAKLMRNGESNAFLRNMLLYDHPKAILKCASPRLKISVTMERARNPKIDNVPSG